MSIVVVGGCAYCEQVAIEVQRRSEAVPVLHRIRDEVEGLRPEGLVSAVLEVFVKGDRTALAQPVEASHGRTGHGAQTADAHILSQPVSCFMPVEGDVGVPTLVLEVVDVGCTGEVAVGVVPILTHNHPFPGDVQALGKSGHRSIGGAFAGDVACLEPHVQKYTVFEIVNGALSAFPILGRGTDHHAVAFHGHSFTEGVITDVAIRSHVAERALVIPIQSVVLEEVDRAGVGAEGVIPGGTHRNPFSVGGDGMASTESNSGFRSHQLGFKSPSAVSIPTEHLHVFEVIGRDQHIAVHGDGGTEVVLDALILADVFVMDEEIVGRSRPGSLGRHGKRRERGEDHAKGSAKAEHDKTVLVR